MCADAEHGKQGPQAVSFNAVDNRVLFTDKMELYAADDAKAKSVQTLLHGYTHASGSSSSKGAVCQEPKVGYFNN